jgi:hypothetical protein
MKNYKITPGKLSSVICAASLISLLFTSCVKQNKIVAPPAALLSFTQASPDEPQVDFYLDNGKVNPLPLNFGDHSDYFNAYIGQRTVYIYNADTKATILSAPFTLNQGTAYSMFLVNTATTPEILLITDTLNKPESLHASIRFINLSPDAATVDLALQGGTVLVPNKSFKEVSSFVSIAAKADNTFEVREKGTGNVLATLPHIDMADGTLYTIWFHGLAGGTSATDKLGVNIITNAAFY